MEPKTNNNDKEKIAARLKEARISSGLSQAQAADIMKLKRPAISEIESGNRKVSADELIQFAKIYKVDTSWILHEDDDKELKFAARELSKLSVEDRQKLMEILKIIPKSNS